MRTKNKDKELNHRLFIGLRLTDVELDLLDQGAACLSICRSEYLRKLLLEKHRSTDKFMNTFKKTVMNRCQQEGLHQITDFSSASIPSLLPMISSHKDRTKSDFTPSGLSSSE